LDSQLKSRLQYQFFFSLNVHVHFSEHVLDCFLARHVKIPLCPLSVLPAYFADVVFFVVVLALHWGISGKWSFGWTGADANHGPNRLSMEQLVLVCLFYVFLEVGHTGEQFKGSFVQPLQSIMAISLRCCSTFDYEC
jgi:hypothetical protein